LIAGIVRAGRIVVRSGSRYSTLDGEGEKFQTPMVSKLGTESVGKTLAEFLFVANC